MVLVTSIIEIYEVKKNEFYQKKMVNSIVFNSGDT